MVNDSIIIQLLILVISLLGLVKGADMFSDFSERVALRFKIPPFIIAVTIVAFGTSLPELFSSSVAVYEGVPEIALGNILGSNITNIFLVLGLATFFIRKKYIEIGYDLIHVDLPFFVGSAFLSVIMLLDGSISFVESLILLAGLLLYIMYSISIRKEHHGDGVLKELKQEHEDIKITVRSVLSGIFGLGLLILGAEFFVKTIVTIASDQNIDLGFLAVTLVPLSSNLPEISVTITNAIKGRAELVVGNILGSNIFNIFGVMGISSLFGKVTAPQELLYILLPVVALSTILYFFITQEKQITKWEGGLMLLSYVVYLNLVFQMLG